MRSPRRLTPIRKGATALPTPSCSTQSRRQRYPRDKQHYPRSLSVRGEPASLHRDLSHGAQSQMGAKPVLDMNGIARRQRARRVLGLDLDHKKARPRGRRMQRARNLLDAFHVAYHAGILEAAGPRHRCEIKAMPGMAQLHAGLAEMVVVDDHDDEVLRIADRDRGKPTEPHQLLAVAREHHDGAVRLRLRETKTNQSGRAHGTPEIIVAVVIAGGVHVVGRRAKPRNDQETVAPGEQAGHHLATIERAWSCCHCSTISCAHHLLAPSSRCDSSTATCCSASNASVAADSTVSIRSRGDSARMTRIPIAASIGAVASPIGTCQGLNSAHSPRMVTSISSGVRVMVTNESMLTQLPTPLDCRRRTLRLPPSQAPVAMAMPSSSVVRTFDTTPGSAANRRMSSEWPASGT